MNAVMRAVLSSIAMLGLALVGSSRADASFASTSSISFFSEPGDFIGQGRQRVFRPDDTTQIGARFEQDGTLGVFAQGPDEGYSFRFRPPSGESFAPRNYVDVDRLGAARGPGRAGMEVEGMGRACNSVSGRYELKELELGPAGEVQRLWLVFQQNCENASAAGYGEIRINAAVSTEQAAVAPGIVRWPRLDPWRTSSTVPVGYVGSTPVASVTVVGAQPQDFPIDANACVGRAGPCDVQVGFSPRAAGAREAALQITDTAGGVHRTTLEGFEHGGVTQLDMDVLPGDVTSAPRHLSQSGSQGPFAGSFISQGWYLTARTPDRSLYQGFFRVGVGAPLQPGTYTAPSSDEGSGPSLLVLIPGGTCSPSGGEFTIRSASTLPDGLVRSLDVDFLQRCYQDRREALRGTWRFRAGDDAPLPAWMLPGSRERIDAPPLTSTPAGGSTTDGATSGGATSGGATSPQPPGGLPAASSIAAVPAPLGSLPARIDAGLGRRVLAAACPAAVMRAARTRLGTAGRDRLRGGTRSDVLLGGRGDDLLTGLQGRDCMSGDAGADVLDGGAGDDVLLGGSGDDRLVGGPGRDLLDCGPGRRDQAVTTRGDQTRGCEVVRRVPG